MKNEKLQHIAMQIFNAPLMIRSQELDVIMEVLGNKQSMSSSMFVDREPVISEQLSISVVPIIGPLMHRSSWWGASYQGIRMDLKNAIEDPDTGAILLDIDSPGGVVDGAFALAEDIYEANQIKPIYAYVNENCYSAAYLFASASSKIFLPTTGSVGSIGVRMVHVDITEWDKEMGIKYTPLFMGERKNDFDPHSTLSEPAKKAAMNDLGELYELFCSTVANYREGLSIQEAKATEAGLYMGQSAVDAHLADQVVNFEGAIQSIMEDVAVTNNRLARGRAGKPKEVSIMTLAEFQAESPDLYKELMDQAKAKVEAALQAKFDAQEETFQGQITSLKGEVETVKEKSLNLEKDNFIRAQNSVKKSNEDSAEKIWVKALVNCDIPERMHEKVRGMIKASAHLADDGTLDEGAFKEAVDAEIADWEGKEMTTAILGTGFQGKTGENPDPDKEAEAKLEAEDDKWVDEMLELSGQTKEGGE